ncbi:MAG: tetratricopeptide repeat protein [Calditrichaeota bacterium]|nr:MAG: tetratricopeptide repeat protein [Calditrichota bacterium]MBL1204095.1 tetratricopeptide repeat protein [Calditrichota bacterium]NOG43926.1 tetratricopeptide repeat protein [Calditrichota bacterium]
MKFRIIFFLLLTSLSISLAQDKRKVAIIPVSNNGNSSIDWISGGLEYLLNNKLSVLSGFYVIDKNSVKAALKEIKYSKGALSERSASQIGRLTNAHVTISGTYVDSASQLNFEILYHNTENGKLIYKEKISTSNNKLVIVADKIVQQLLHISGVPVSSSERALMNRSLTKNNKAFESFIKAYMENNKPNPNSNIVIGLFREAIAKDKNFWEAYYNLGILYFNSKQYKQALNQFNKIIKALPNFDKPYYGRGLIYEKEKKYDLALADFKKVTEFNPNDPKPFYYMGKISILDKDYTNARKYLNKSTDINPDYAPAYFEYGNLLTAQKQIRKAIPDYRKAVELDPFNNRYRQTLGEVYYRSQIFYNALIEFQAILSRDPNNAVANFMKGVTIYKQAVLEELVEAFLDLLDESTNGKKASNESKFKKTTGIDPVKKRKVYDDMVNSFTKASQARPKFMQATFNLALTYLEMGNFNLAEKYFKTTILISPNLIKAHTKLAEVYEKTKRLPQAIEQYKKVFYIEPAIFVRKPTLGPEHQYRNVLEIFLRELDTKIKRNPNDSKSNIVLAKVFRAQGFNGKAANILRSILNRNPRHSEAKKLLARIEKGQR